MLKQLLSYGAPAVALFVCVWACRVFVAVGVVELFMPLAGRLAIALVAVAGGLLPALPLGVGYGLIREQPVLAAALVVALIACALELTLASLFVPWWDFVTWWVLPVECVTVIVFFPLAAWVGSYLLSGGAPVVRRRIGFAVFAVLTLCAIALAWV